jgi:hypothetical protein
MQRERFRYQTNGRRKSILRNNTRLFSRKCLAWTNIPSFIGILIAILVGCRQPGQIDRVVEEASSDPEFLSGLHNPIKLPEGAPPAQVAAAALFDSRTNLTILEIRRVTISYGDQREVAPETTKYVAVLVDMQPGRKVVLMQYHRGMGWLDWVYEVK